MGKHRAPTAREARRLAAVDPTPTPEPATEVLPVVEPATTVIPIYVDHVDHGAQLVPDDLEQLSESAWTRGQSAALAATLAAVVTAGIVVAPSSTGEAAEVPVSGSVYDAIVATQGEEAIHKITPEEAGRRLELLAASRTKADQEREAAAQVQAAADQAAIDAQREAQEVAQQAAEAQAAQEAAEAEQAAQEAHSASGVIVPGGRLTSGFGLRWGTLHAGIDLAAPLGTDIYSPISGTVIEAGPASGFGLWLCIEDGNGDVWVFGHMTSFNVGVGDTVSAGDLISWVGNNGQSTGPHVHIERHLGGLAGTKVDPSGRLAELGYL